MNNNLKTISYIVALGIFAVCPHFAYAESRSACQEIKEKENRAESLFSQHGNQFENFENEFENELKETLSLFESNRTAQKNNADIVLKKHFEDISKRATTTTQKTAVKKYTDAVKNIAQERTVRIESIQQEYKDSIKNLFAQKKSVERVLLAQYKESSKRAFENTFRNCEKGRPTFIFKRELKKEMEGNHKIFTQQLTSTSYEQSLLDLKSTRDLKIQDAQNIFAQKHASLIQTLRTSLAN